MSRDSLLTDHSELEWLENGPEFVESEDPPTETDSQNQGRGSQNGSAYSGRERTKRDFKGKNHGRKSSDVSDSQSQRSSFEDVISDSHISDSHISDSHISGDSDGDTESQ